MSALSESITEVAERTVEAPKATVHWAPGVEEAVLLVQSIMYLKTLRLIWNIGISPTSDVMDKTEDKVERDLSFLHHKILLSGLGVIS